MVVVIASGLAAERGIIFKSAEAMETAYKASHVVFDKTGTLTRGKMTVVAEHCSRDDDDDGGSLPLLLILVAQSRHPVSAAVAEHLRSRGVVAPPSPPLVGVREPARARPGGGGGGRADAAGGQRTLGRGVVARGGRGHARPGPHRLLLRRRQRPGRGVAVHLVSGDDDGAVRSAAAALGIPARWVRARASSGDKQAYVRALVEAGGRRRPVVFCDGGTNDAAALAQATVGVHVNGGGSNVARCAADVVLLRPGAAGALLVDALAASRRAAARVRFNFAWSFAYNALAVALAAGALVRVRIAPQWAALGELVSVLPVVAAAVLLRWF